jgi:hypothetical protein
MADRVRGYSASPRSTLEIVVGETPAADAKSRTPNSKAARAIRHWAAESMLPCDNSVDIRVRMAHRAEVVTM